MNRIILHLDMNSYFASAEQQANPFFRNKPVGVCAYLSDFGCIIASSIEAKKLGIKTGFRVRDAKKICPSIILVENDVNKYRTVTRQFFKIMNDYSDGFEPYSIDEAFLDLTGWAKDFQQAQKVADEIRQRIKVEIGSWLRCSVGISFTKFLAKFASDVATVDQLKVIEFSSQLDIIFTSYKLTDLWGINIHLEKRLNSLGVYTILDLKNYPVQNLLQVLGKAGYYLWANVNGLEINHLRSSHELESKSIGHSYCLPKQTTDKNYLFSVLFKLVAKVGTRLRDRNKVAYGVSIHWFYVNRLDFGKPRTDSGSKSAWGKSFKLKKPVFSTDDIFKCVYNVLHQTKLRGPVMMLAVGVFNLREPSNQLELFDPLDNLELIKAVDKINSRYGNQVIYRGRMWKTENLAKDRIGFRKIEL